jgi:hypothetical protein
LCLVAALAAVLSFVRPTPASAQDRGELGARIERLEKRLNELAERQEQFMHRLGTQMERQGGRQGERQRPGVQPRNPRMRSQLPPPGAPGAPGPHDAQAAKAHKGLQDLLGMLLFIGVICNILLAIWIYTDIRKRNEGSGIFVAMALVAGIPAALIYALTRIGDKKA